MKSAPLFLALSLVVCSPAMSSFADDIAPVPPVVEVEPTNDPEAVKFLLVLRRTMTQQTEEEALAAIKQLVAYWKDPAVKPETKVPMPGLVARYATRDVPVVALASVAGLTEIGVGEGSKNLLAVLATLLERDESDANRNTRDAVFAALKKLADPEENVVKALLKLFHYKDDVVVASAVDAVGGYAAAPVELRRSLFEDTLKAFEGVASESKRPASKSAFNRWSIVGKPVSTTLAALAHRAFEDLAAARQWFNDYEKDADAWK